MRASDAPPELYIEHVRIRCSSIVRAPALGVITILSECWQDSRTYIVGGEREYSVRRTMRRQRGLSRTDRVTLNPNFILDCLTQIDFRRPKVDLLAVEQGVRAHLAECKNASRPIRWFDSLSNAYRYVSTLSHDDRRSRKLSKELNAGRKAATRALKRAGVRSRTVLETSPLTVAADNGDQGEGGRCARGEGYPFAEVLRTTAGRNSSCKAP
jgi:hypothetical protein